MEKSNGSVVNERMKLPVGFRFHPTDEELLFHYLRRKAFGLPFPSPFIHDFDVFKTHPHSLPGDMDEKNRYFFTRKERDANGNSRCKIPTVSGYWKPIGKDKHIVASARSNLTVGIKRTLVYREAKESNHGLSKTRWFMHEYRFAGSAAILISKSGGEEWAVYRVFRRKIKANRNNKLPKRSMSQPVDLRIEPDCIDFTAQDGKDNSDFGPPLPDSPCLEPIS